MKTNTIRFIVWNIDSQEKAKDVAPISSKLASLLEKDQCNNTDKYFILVLTECHQTVADKIIEQVTEHGTLSVFSDDSYPADGGIQFIYKLPTEWELKPALNEKILLSVDEILTKIKTELTKSGNRYINLASRIFSTTLTSDDTIINIVNEFIKLSEGNFDDNELMKKLRFVKLSDRQQNTKALLVGVHFWSKKDLNNHYNRNKKLIAFINDYLNSINEDDANKCILLGDFNMNPYETMLNTNPDVESLASHLRTSPNENKISYNRKDWFYNPCWNLLGDRFSKINHTFSFKKSKEYENLFNVFDQVLLRKGLFMAFQLPTLKIEDTGDISDHFPVIFEMKFLTENPV